jgi:MFS family permease
MNYRPEKVDKLWMLRRYAGGKAIVKLSSSNQLAADTFGYTNACVNALASNRWMVLAVLFLARTAMGFQFQSVATLTPSLISKLSIDYTQLGLLVGIYLLPGIIIAYPGGLLGQRFGDKRVTILALALMVAGGLLTGISHGYAVFLVGRVISGIGAVLLNVLLTKMAADWFAGREVGTALALLISSWPIGIGLALLVLPWAAEASSAATAFIMTAMAAAMILLLLAAIYRVPNAADKAPLAGAPAFGLSGREFCLVSLAGVVWALFNCGYIILISFAPSLLIAQGMNVKGAAIATSLASWAVVPTIALGGLLVDRIGHATALMITSLSILGLSIMLIPGDPSLVLMAFIGAVGGLPCGAMLVLPVEVLRPQSRALGMGTFYTWYYLVLALLTPVAGFVRDFTGDPGRPLTFAGLLEIAAIAALILLRLLQHRYGLRPLRQWQPSSSVNLSR